MSFLKQSALHWWRVVGRLEPKSKEGSSIYRSFERTHNFNVGSLSIVQNVRISKKCIFMYLHYFLRFFLTSINLFTLILSSKSGTNFGLYFPVLFYIFLKVCNLCSLRNIFFYIFLKVCNLCALRNIFFYIFLKVCNLCALSIIKNERTLWICAVLRTEHWLLSNNFKGNVVWPITCHTF